MICWYIINFPVRRGSSSNGTEESESPREPESDLLTNSVENITDSIFHEASASYSGDLSNLSVMDDRADIIQAMDSELPTTSTTLRHRNVVPVQPVNTIAPCGSFFRIYFFICRYSRFHFSQRCGLGRQRNDNQVEIFE